MVCWPEFRPGAVALLATKGQFDLVVAHQTISHLRKIRAAHRVGRLDASMTREAGVGAVQVLANVAGGRKILPAIDRLRNDRRDVAKLQMFLMAEMREQRLGRLRNRDALMAWLANRRRRQVVVLRPRAVRDGCMSTCAVRFQLQMRAVGKRRCRRR